MLEQAVAADVAKQEAESRVTYDVEHVRERLEATGSPAAASVLWCLECKEGWDKESHRTKVLAAPALTSR
jgi:hypothetical protein